MRRAVALEAVRLASAICSARQPRAQRTAALLLPAHTPFTVCPEMRLYAPPYDTEGLLDIRVFRAITCRCQHAAAVIRYVAIRPHVIYAVVYEPYAVHVRQQI